MPGSCARALLLAVVGLLSGCALVPTPAGGSGGPVVSTAVSRTAVSGKDGTKIWFPERLDRGLILILPGSWGDSPADHGIVKGLLDSDVDSSVEIYDWTAGHWIIG